MEIQRDRKNALVQQQATLNKENNIKRGIKAVEEAAPQEMEPIGYPELACEFCWLQKRCYGNSP
ncbi:MAG: hypothetical protein ACFFD4_20395 [Candidatus Odinarchaeota archaeon]